MGKIVAIIPARGGSKAIPKKNIIEFCGKPLIAWTIIRAIECPLISATYVTTDCSEIASVASEFGAKVINRPPELASDTATSESALIHALDYIDILGPVDAIAFLQPTSPLRYPNDLQKAIQTFYDQNLDSLFSASILEDFCIWSKNGSELKSLTFDYLSRGRRQDRDPLFVENGSIYITKASILRASNNRLGGTIGMYLMNFFQTFELDSCDDLDLLEFYMNHKINTVS